MEKYYFLSNKKKKGESEDKIENRNKKLIRFEFKFFFFIIFSILLKKLYNKKIKDNQIIERFKANEINKKFSEGIINNSITLASWNISKENLEILNTIQTESLSLTENAIINETSSRKKRIGVIGADHGQNIGNNLLKYAMFIKLKELGFEPEIVGHLRANNNISFLNKTIKIKYIYKSFKTEINRTDYDILMVNSDQIWRKTNLNYRDIGFLEFAKDWKIPKFIYGASLGINQWLFNMSDDKYFKELLKNFTGTSVREKGLIELAKRHLDIEPQLVVDPTLLIDKEYYLDLIKDYKNEFNVDDKYIFIYKIDQITAMDNFIKEASEKENYKIYDCSMDNIDYIQRFIYGIYHSNAVITTSYHGTLFSIIFNKPFVAFNLETRGNDRFNTLRDVYGLGNRIFSVKGKPDLSLLSTAMEINITKINELKNESINYLKKNLNINQ